MISGDAKFGIEYNSDPDDNKSKHSFTHEMGVDFTGSGSTDGGLTFGGKAGFDTGKAPYEGTVFVSGSFGTLTFGDNSSADKLSGGIADVGLGGVGVDDVVEGIYGSTADQFRYDQSMGNISLALSAGTGTSSKATLTAPAMKKNDFAIGMSFSASGATVGLGYDSKKAISAGFGYSTGQISANVFYAKRDDSLLHHGNDYTIIESGGQILVSGNNPSETGADMDGMYNVGFTGLGMDVSYTMGASTVTLVYAKTDVDGVRLCWCDLDGAGTGIENGWLTSDASLKGLGIGFTHELGGGAKLEAGFAKVPMYKSSLTGDGALPNIGQVADADATRNKAAFDALNDPDSENANYLSRDKNVASIGLSFTF